MGAPRTCWECFTLGVLVLSSGACCAVLALLLSLLFDAGGWMVRVDPFLIGGAGGVFLVTDQWCISQHTHPYHREGLSATAGNRSIPSLCLFLSWQQLLTLGRSALGVRCQGLLRRETSHTGFHLLLFSLH